MRRLQLGDTGPAVADIRSVLGSIGLLSEVHADDQSLEFDEPVDGAIRAFQQMRGLVVDGIVGPATYRVLREASFHLGARTLYYQLSAPLYGDDIAALQRRLQELGFYVSRVDGYFGLKTHDALQSFQREMGLAVDGICGPEALRALGQLGARVTGGNPHRISEEELVRRSGPQLTGKRIVLDPGLGGPDTGETIRAASGDITEAELLWDLANRLEGRMAATGMDTFLSRSSSVNPTDAERAATANSFDADLMISLRCGRNPSTAANGVATFHYGTAQGSVSTIGQLLSSYMQREIVARTKLGDCRVHGRTWDLLRLTKMPTVQVEVGYVTNESDAMQLSDPKVRNTIAEAILIAVKRLYLLGQDDQPTGTFTFEELLAEELSNATER